MNRRAFIRSLALVPAVAPAASEVAAIIREAHRQATATPPTLTATPK